MSRSASPAPPRSVAVTAVVPALASALALVTLAAACGEGRSRSGDPSLTVDVAVSPTPASTTDTRVVVTLHDGGATAPGWQVRLHAEGPDGARTPEVELEERSGARYASGALAFPAPGEWTFVVSVVGPGSRQAEFRRPVTVSEPAAGGTGRGREG